MRLQLTGVCLAALCGAAILVPVVDAHAAPLGAGIAVPASAEIVRVQRDPRDFDRRRDFERDLEREVERDVEREVERDLDRRGDYRRDGDRGRDFRWRGRVFRDLEPRDVADFLRDRGYYDVEVREGRRGFRANGCRDRGYYEFRVTFDGELVDRERIGRCDDRERIRVEAPGIDLDNRGGVRLRVPGVDLVLPR